MKRSGVGPARSGVVALVLALGASLTTIGPTAHARADAGAVVTIPAGAAAATVEAATADAATDPCLGAPRAFFRDVADGATAAGAIDCLVWHDLVRGVTYERFVPAAPLTRAQVATLLDRLVTEVSTQLPDPRVRRFTDVDGVHAPAIERLAAAGIVTGSTVDRYRPDAPVRRDQLASLLLRTYHHLAGTAEDTPVAVTHAFTDVSGTTHEASIATATRLGLVGGRTATTYDPSGSTTRGQTAMVLARLLHRSVADGAIAATLAAPDGHARRVTPLPSSLLVQIERWTWEPGCPVPPRDLRLLELVHTDLTGTDRWGLLVVHRDVTTAVADAFEGLHTRGFRVARMEPIERFRGDDDASMAANNTSAFNCRRVTGGTSFSEHAFGRAIDINPVQNPYVRGTTVLPSAGRAYLDRSDVRPGMLVRPGGVTPFDRIGWGWGGDYSTLKDYQHVSSSGR